jgi:hypothetical protein
MIAYLFVMLFPLLPGGSEEHPEVVKRTFAYTIVTTRHSTNKVFFMVK